MSKSEAFLAQATSDLGVFKTLFAINDGVAPECHALHYFQMSIEKLFKAIYLHENGNADTMSHIAFKKIQHRLKRRDIGEFLRWKRYSDYLSFLRRTMPILREVELLCPALAIPKEMVPNLEYPWECPDAHGGVVWKAPILHNFGILRKLQASEDGRTLIWFLEQLCKHFSQFFF